MAFKRRYGIVAIVDALGMRSATIQDSERFLNVRRQLVKSSFQRWPVASGHEADTGNDSNTSIYFQSFADTLIVAVELMEFSSEHGKTKFPTASKEADALFYGMWIERLSYVLGDLLRDAMTSGVVFRGALTSGQYILDKRSNSILGPAINDVVSWYESFESTGIILTPHASMVIDYVSLHRKLLSSVTKTELFLKSNQKINQYVVNWPNAFLKGDYSEENKKKAWNHFRFVLTQLAIPRGTEQKYYSAEGFFREILDREKA